MNLILNQGKVPEANVEQIAIDLSDSRLTVIRANLSAQNKVIYDNFIAVITNKNCANIIENTPFDLEAGRITSSEIGNTTSVRNYNNLSQSDKTALTDFNTMVNSL